MNEYNRRQLKAMCFAASLAPVTRLLPKTTAQIAGRAGWLAPLCALPLLLLFLLMLSALMKTRREGEGLGEVLLRRAGRTPACIGLGLIAAFHIFSAGFILRTGAHRLISTIYPAAEPWFFMIVMLLAGTLAALGPVKALPRAARVFSPVLLAVLLLTLGLSLDSVELRSLLPVTGTNFGSLLLSSLAVVEIYGGMLCCAAFLEDRAPLEGRRFASHAGWLALICLLLCAFCAIITGCYGAPLVARFSHPFFSTARDVTLMKTVERLDALVATLWVLSDFVIFSLLLCTSSHILRLIFGFRPEKCEKRPSDMSNGRALILLCAALSALAAALIPSNEAALLNISRLIVPAASLAVLFIVLPALLLISFLEAH